MSRAEAIAAALARTNPAAASAYLAGAQRRAEIERSAAEIGRYVERPEADDERATRRRRSRAA